MNGFRNKHMAPVMPIRMYESLTDEQLLQLGPYHLMLAHHVVEEEDGFRRLSGRLQTLFSSIPRHSTGCTIIMDNSLVELGGPIPLDMMEKACRIVKNYNVEVIAVLPDAMGDGAETLRLYQMHIEQWRTRLEHVARLMVVLQANGMQEYREMLDFFGDPNNRPSQPSPRLLFGIPRYLHKTLGSRIEAVKMFETFIPGHLVHLLGFSDDLWDDIQAANASNAVMGMDSAVPYRVEEMPLSRVLPKRGKWWDEGVISKNYLKNHQRMVVLMNPNNILRDEANFIIDTRK